MRTELVNQRSASEGGIEKAYRVLLRDPDRVDELRAPLGQAEGLSNISVLMHTDEAEI